MVRPSTTRRQLLRRGGAALGVATLTNLAGCAAPDLGPGDESALPAYATWLPVPDHVLRDPGDAEDPSMATQRRYYPFRATAYDDVATHWKRLGRAPPAP